MDKDNVPNDEDDKEKLKQHLKRCGLDVQFWTSVLKKELNVSGLSPLQGFSENEITKLQLHVRHKYERTNLRNLLKPTCTHEQIRELKDMITDLKKELSTSDVKHSGKVERQLHILKSKLLVGEKDFKLPANNDELKTVVDSISNNFDNLQGNIKECKTLLDYEVIENASAGLAFSGIYPNDLHHTFQRASTVLEFKDKDKVRLKQSSMNQFDSVDTFNNFEKYDKHHINVETLGVKVSGKLKASFFLVAVDAEASYNRHEEKEERTQHNYKKTFYCRERSCSVPVQSFEMRQDLVCLTPEAVSRLQRIEALIVMDIYEKEYIQAECIEFFKEFGCFVNLGILEFGGTYRWKATYESEFKSDEKRTREQLITALNGYVTAGISFGPKSLGGSVSTGNTSQEGKSDFEHNRHDQQKTTFQIRKTGGPIEVDNFCMWRYGLVSFNSTWSLIDRGELVGIWKIVDTQKSDFSDSIKLSMLLKEAWGNRKTIPNADLSQGKIFHRNMRVILDKMQQWSKDSQPCPDVCVDILKDLNTTRRQIWNVLELKWNCFVANNEIVQMFIQRIVQQKDRFDVIMIQLVKNMLREMLQTENADNLPKSTLVSAWMLQDEKEDSCSRTNFGQYDIEDLKQFLLVLDQKFISYLERKNPIKTDDIDYITIEFQKICRECLYNMKHKKQFFNVILMTAILVLYSFDVIHLVFQRNLTIASVKQIKEKVQNMLSLQESATSRVMNEICIANQFIDNIRNRANIHDDDKQIFKRYFSPIRNGECTKEFAALLKGQEDTVQFELKKLQEKIMALQNNKKGRLSSRIFTETRTNEDNRVGKETHNPEIYSPSNSLIIILKQLGLFEYYPEKIKLNDVLSLKTNSKSVLKDIPWIFLKGIISCDRRWRGEFLSNLLDNVNKPDSSTYVDPWRMKPLEDSKEHSTIVSLHPLDLTVVVYLCCSPNLKQLFAEKMWLCKLAFPLITYHSERLIANLWSIRQCIIEERINEKSLEEKSAADTNSLIVSVIRFGKISVSKSIIINTLISKKGSDIFHHRDCSLGTSIRVISNGTIESAWCISTDRSITYLNLRGDALDFPIQVEVLLKISSVLVVMLPIDLLGDKCITSILSRRCIISPNCGIILAFDGHTTKRNNALEKVTLFFKNDSVHDESTKVSGLALSGEHISLDNICQDLKQKISILVGKNEIEKSFSEKLNCCDQVKVCVDDNLEMYKRYRLLVDALINHIPRDSSNVKEIIVPLQGKLLETLTDAFKMSKMPSHKLGNKKVDDLLTTVDKIRKEQMDKYIKQASPFIKQFLVTLINFVQAEEHYIIFVRYLKLYLDCESRKVIPRERRKYQQILFRIQEVQESGGLVDAFMKNEVEIQEKNLAEASFGLEHLYREFGQIYEALSSQKSYLNEDDLIFLENIPKVAANLLLKGESFELMNGDVGNVPLVWVESVFGHIKNIIGDRKVLILSVLGIQSSGKSTLLNTMFGLQFAVSAGRCTRGLYMQLLPVNNNEGFDYLLVVDTEGIRAPELKDQYYNHDNKLATFVIGLGDVILINIKGENTAELTDILGIVVQALMRLKMVSKTSHLQKRCIFVHQNVPASDAKDKMLQQRKMLVDELNKRTKGAAEEENARDIERFSDILNFDLNNDVIYFPDLWDGSPPMASVNPDYSEHAQKVKDSVMSSTVASGNTHCTILETLCHVKDLWNGLLADDFVFSFRNNLEINAYMRIQSKFVDIMLGLETYMNDYICNECKTTLQSKLEIAPMTDPISLLPPIEEKMIMQFVSKRSEQHKKIETIFENDEKKEVVIQWKESKKNLLDEHFSTLLFNAKNRLKLLARETRFRMIHEIQIADFETKAYNMAATFASTYTGENHDDVILFQEFTLAWSGFADVPEVETSDSVETIHSNINLILCEMFHDRITTIQRFQKLLSEKWQTNTTKKLFGSISIQDIDAETQIVEKNPNVYSIFKFRFSGQTTQKQALKVTNFIFKAIDIEIKKFSSTTNTKFDTTFVKKLFNIIVTKLSHHNNEGNNCFKFTKDHETFLLVHTSFFLQKKLANLNAFYNKKFSLKSKQQQQKEKAWTIFKMIVKSESADTIAAFYFEEVLFNAVTEKFSTKIPTKVVKKMIRTFYSSKWELIKEILIHLANERSFDDYIHYIQSPETFVQLYLQNRTSEKFFTKRQGATEYFNFAVNQANIDLDDVLHVLYELKTNTEELTNSKLVDLLRIRLQSTLKVTIMSSAFAQIKLRMKNKTRFLDIAANKIDGLKKSVPKQFEDTSDKNVKWTVNPYDKMMKTLWGCDAKCPFCKEPCMNAQKGHATEVPHRCASHRVKGVAGWYVEKTENLSETFCNICISEDLTSFEHKGTFIKYKDYKTIYPDWDILPNPEVSVYWKWFCCQYKQRLEEEYERKIEICDHWKKLSISDAINSITYMSS